MSVCRCGHPNGDHPGYPGFCQRCPCRRYKPSEAVAWSPMLGVWIPADRALTADELYDLVSHTDLDGDDRPRLTHQERGLVTSELDPDLGDPYEPSERLLRGTR